MDGTLLDKKYNIVGRIEALEEGGGGGGYVLPVASDETLGGIKVGAGLEINSETGVLSNTNPTPYTPVSYSTTEQATGQKWIDGKDIYRKVVDFGALPNNTKKAVASGLTGETIVKLYGIANSGGDYTSLPSTATNAVYTITLGYNVTDHEIVIYTATDMTSYNAYVVLEYTKAVVTRKKK